MPAVVYFRDIFLSSDLLHTVTSLVLSLYIVHVLQQNAEHSAASRLSRSAGTCTLVSVGTGGLAAPWVHIIRTVIQPVWTSGRSLSINTLVRRPLSPHDQSWDSVTPAPHPPTEPSPPCDYECRPTSVCLDEMTSTPLRRPSSCTSNSFLLLFSLCGIPASLYNFI